ncbi:tripartite tricarboxylate transporter permease [Campylobacter hepaticus]|uniref:Tripartite tricarboxylate transporter permease n=1 Tax=Campylobacter hepaticus TaxID=1813019 RepID=A0A424Z3M2_9BACT|nr:tripartite tricarboxylate transporter permease [Campylobacter hepaticus]AXP09422.1 tripartite tricarboxylate transporter permease [Campylobacter hepaticus]MCZ0772832.1 tripartite tricarboxylate transporter permease [Campylobacter hepaticus]MCZ0774301.1 tripartite tricarboxylate transporter permease [Campylobacter hepaticus]MCZ0775553.1 tripartite tricarboxylate transporter permease [Campylobacter hepaticus]MDX2331012.1 tripartite tricarboxylate transporter permease [Campylobacter hepaticus]
MDTWMYLMQGFNIALDPYNILIALIGCFIGTIVGMLPGLGPINGVAILLPLAFGMNLPAESAIILLATVYMGCEYGGRISSILLGIPGDAAAIMTTLDGHPLAKKGLAGKALSISALSSFIGSFIAICGIILFAPLIAQWSLKFGPAEYFALIIFGLASLGSMLAQKPIRSFLSALIGLFLTTIGIDGNTGVYRFTFDNPHLYDGISFIILVIGLFSVSEIFFILENTRTSQNIINKTGKILVNLKEFFLCFSAIIRSSILGFFVGVLPGAGATIASAITYMSEKKIAGIKGKFGQGDLKGVAAPEAANNASACGSFIPMLTLGLPGSGTTAVMMGALTLYNITPGPTMFSEQANIVWGLIASLLFANVVLLLMNLPLIRIFVKILSIPMWSLAPIIIIVSIIGIYSINSTSFDIILILIIGILAYILRKLEFPMAPLILGFVLGEQLETNLRRALSISNGDLSILWSGSIAPILLVGAILIIILPLLIKKLRKSKI